MSTVQDRPFIPLSSDTETKPTAAMRVAVANAEVGDEQGRDVERIAARNRPFSPRLMEWLLSALPRIGSPGDERRLATECLLAPHRCPINGSPSLGVDTCEALSSLGQVYFGLVMAAKFRQKLGTLLASEPEGVLGIDSIECGDGLVVVAQRRVAAGRQGTYAMTDLHPVDAFSAVAAEIEVKQQRSFWHAWTRSCGEPSGQNRLNGRLMSIRRSVDFLSPTLVWSVTQP